MHMSFDTANEPPETPMTKLGTKEAGYIVNSSEFSCSIFQAEIVSIKHVDDECVLENLVLSPETFRAAE